MKAQYIRLMDMLHRALPGRSPGVCLVIITIIIPWGVFTRYVLNSASSWPEPMAVLLMIWLSFLSAAFAIASICISASALLPMMLTGNARTALGWFIEICMLATNLFMLWYGIKLVQATWYQAIAEFPGWSRSACPICRSRSAGAITALFVIERMWTGVWFQDPTTDDLGSRSQPNKSAGTRSWTLSFSSAASPSLCLLGVPVAYALGLAAILARALDRASARSRDAEDVRRHGRFLAAGDPVLHPRRRASWPKAAWPSA